MPATLDIIARDALILPQDQRLALARQLLESVNLEPEPGAEAAWEAEIARRIARFKSGEAKPIPAGEVFARLRMPTREGRRHGKKKQKQKGTVFFGEEG